MYIGLRHPVNVKLEKQKENHTQTQHTYCDNTKNKVFKAARQRRQQENTQHVEECNFNDD